MTSLRVGTWNAASGRTADGRQARPDDLAAAVAALDVDVLAVQELDVRHCWKSRPSQCEYPAQST